jgi:hypothetical protein
MNKNLLKTLLISCIGFGAMNAYAQDPEFTQFYAAPIYTNPAMAGSAVCNSGMAGRFAIKRNLPNG